MCHPVKRSLTERFFEFAVEPADEDHLEDSDDEEAGGEARVEEGEEVDAALEAEGQAAQEEGGTHANQHLLLRRIGDQK